MNNLPRSVVPLVVQQQMATSLVRYHATLSQFVAVLLASPSDRRDSLRRYPLFFYYLQKFKLNARQCCRRQRVIVWTFSVWSNAESMNPVLVLEQRPLRSSKMQKTVKKSRTSTRAWTKSESWKKHRIHVKWSPQEDINFCPANCDANLEEFSGIYGSVED